MRQPSPAQLCSTTLAVVLLSCATIPTWGGPTVFPDGTHDEKNTVLPKTIPREQVFFLVEMIELDQKDLTPLLADESLFANSSALRVAVQDLINKGAASISGTIMTTAARGQHAVASSVQESVFVSEYEPPKGRQPDSPITPSGLTGADLPTPVTWRTRGIGTTLEVDIEASSSTNNITFSLSLETVRKTPSRTLQEIPSGDSATLPTIVQPTFYTMQTTTTATVTNGKHTLIGTHSPPSESGDPHHSLRVLVFVRVSLVTSGSG